MTARAHPISRVCQADVNGNGGEAEDGPSEPPAALNDEEHHEEQPETHEQRRRDCVLAPRRRPKPLGIVGRDGLMFDVGKQQAGVGFEPTNNGFAIRPLRPRGYPAARGRCEGRRTISSMRAVGQVIDSIAARSRVFVAARGAAYIFSLRIVVR